MSLLHIEIDKVRTGLLKDKLHNELDDNYLDDNYPVERKETILKLLTVLEGGTGHNKNTLDKYFSTISDNAFSKTWARLNDYHKIVKLKEYVKLTYKDQTDDEIKKIEDTLIQYVKDKKLNAGKLVTYDSKTMKIISVPKLVVDENCNVSLK